MLFNYTIVSNPMSLIIRFVVQFDVDSMGYDGNHDPLACSDMFTIVPNVNTKAAEALPVAFENTHAMLKEGA